MGNNLETKFRKKYKKALVTGGAGFIGSHICEELIKLNIEVVSIDDFTAGKKKNVEFMESASNFRSVNCDITDKEKLAEYFEGVDIVFHNAASKKTVCLKDPIRDLEVNGKGTLILLQLSLENGVKKFIHASTGSVYGEAQYFPQDEKHPLAPVSYYGVSKLAGESYVNLFSKLYNFDTTVLRYFHVFGPRQESNEFGGVVSIFIRNMINKENPIIFGDGTQERSFTYVKDVVSSNLLVSMDKQTSGQTYNCASGISVTIQELCDKTIEFFDMKGILSPTYGDWLIGDIKKFNVDNRKLRGIGMNFGTNFFELLKQTIDEMKIYLQDS